MAIKFNDDFEEDGWRQELENWKPELPQTNQTPGMDILPWWIHPWNQQLPLGAPPQPNPAVQGYPSWVDPQFLPLLPSLIPQRINSTPIAPDSATDTTSAASGDDLLGILYEMMPQASPNPDDGSSSNLQDSLLLASPQRRLGKRAYRP